MKLLFFQLYYTASTMVTGGDTASPHEAYETSGLLLAEPVSDQNCWERLSGFNARFCPLA